MEAIRTIEGDCIWECGVGQIEGFTLDVQFEKSDFEKTVVNAGVEVESRVCPSEDTDSVLC